MGALSQVSPYGIKKYAGGSSDPQYMHQIKSYMLSSNHGLQYLKDALLAMQVVRVRIMLLRVNIAWSLRRKYTKRLGTPRLLRNC